jgi:adenylosuccinate lyase
MSENSSNKEIQKNKYIELYNKISFLETTVNRLEKEIEEMKKNNHRKVIDITLRGKNNHIDTTY